MQNSEHFGFSLLEKPFAHVCCMLRFRGRSARRSQTQLRSYGFSLLEKPFARTECTSGFTPHRKAAFSLAEGMVMLVVVSILMAVSAPLIAKKSAADSKRIFSMRGQNIVGAIKDSQTLNLGNDDNNTALKLDAKGLVRANQFGVNGDSLEISKSDNTILFSVDSDGVTNIPLGIPDFGSNNDGTDGYIYVNDITVGDHGDGHNNESACQSFVTITGNGKTYNSRAYINLTIPDGETTRDITACVHMPMLIPVSSGATAIFNDGSTLESHKIELKKAKADTSNLRTQKTKTQSSTTTQPQGNGN